MELVIVSEETQKLREDPWIPDTPHFKFPTNFNCPANLFYVRDLMNSDRCSWNLDLIHRVVPPQTAMLIRKINVLDNPEQEALIWVPSKTGGKICVLCNSEIESAHHLMLGFVEKF